MIPRKIGVVKIELGVIQMEVGVVQMEMGVVQMETGVVQIETGAVHEIVGVVLTETVVIPRKVSVVCRTSLWSGVWSPRSLQKWVCLMESQCHDRAVIVGKIPVGHCRVGVVTTEVGVLGWSHNVMIGQL